MIKSGYAYFAARPRRIEDLLKPHDIRRETPFHIVKTIYLRAIDYENFTTDLLADRGFIEAFSPLCKKPEDCLFVTRRQRQEGVLVRPEEQAYVKAAAYVKWP